MFGVAHLLVVRERAILLVVRSEVDCGLAGLLLDGSIAPSFEEL